jgi:hypothetical protein
MQRARTFVKDWDGNRKRDTALRRTNHHLGECKIFMDDRFAGQFEAVDFQGDREAVDPSSAPGRFASFSHAVCDEFPASRGVLFLTHSEKVGSNEVKQ